MKEETINIISAALEGVTRWEWDIVKRSIEQEYKMQSLNLPFEKTSRFTERTVLMLREAEKDKKIKDER